MTVDHVKVKNKVVVDGTSVPLMAETLAWHAFCVAGAPNVVGPMTLALVSTSTPPLPSSRSLVLRQQLVTPSLCGMTTLVNPMQFAAATGGGANIATIADPLIAAEVVSSGKFAVLKIGFSALHRLGGPQRFHCCSTEEGHCELQVCCSRWPRQGSILGVPGQMTNVTGPSIFLG